MNTDGTYAGRFGTPTQLQAGEYTLHLFSMLNGAPATWVERPNGEFIAQTGVFYYRGATGPRALDQLFDDFDGRRFPWADCRGHYAIVVWRGNRLFVANDALGTYKVYHDREHRTLSSSFIAVRQTLPRLTIDRQGCYEYAWNGTPFGEKTFLNEIRMFPKGRLVELAPEPTVVDEWNLTPSDTGRGLSFEETAQSMAARLRELFRVYTADNRGPVRLPLTGGYDSRLLVALLLDAGVRPELFIYGPAGDREADLARRVAEGEGLPFEQIDKTLRPSTLDWIERARRAYDLYDGWTEVGLFDDGSDAEERLTRAAGDRLLFNGSVGEIYRNFYNLPDGRYHLRHLVWTYYSYLEPKACTAAFRADEYEDALIAEMARAIGTDGGVVSRSQIEALYPLFRGRYWAAREVSISNRFQRSLCPFLETSVIQGTPEIPIAYKQYGRLQARIMQIIRPSIAQHLSTRGFRPADPISLRYKIRTQLIMRRPTRIRRWSYRLRFRRPQPFPTPLLAPALKGLVDTNLPVMREFFHPERIFDPDVYNRVCAMEWLAGSPTLN